MSNSNSSAAVLGTGNIRKLLIQYSGPAIAAMMASALYNVIDRMFIGQGVSALAISGLAITMPVMNLSAAFGAMIGAGGATLTSIKMGQQDHPSTLKVLGNVVLLNVVLGIIFMILGLAFIDEILYFFGASDDTIPYARDFMQVILIGNVITHLYLGLNNVMRASGNPQKAMLVTIMTVLINLALAPLFIFVFHWGIRGAATATISSQLVALLVVIHHFNNKSSFLHFQRSIFKFDKRNVSSILSIGMAPFMLNLMIFAMLVMGFNQGMQPIAGYNFGAQQYSRVRAVLKITIICATITTTCAFLIAESIPYYMARLFTNDEELIQLTILGLRVCVIAFPIVGFQMVTSNFFQSIGKAPMAVILSSTRQLLLLIPLLLILPNFYGTIGVFASMPISDCLSTIIALTLLRREMKHFSKLKDKTLIIESNNTTL